MDFFYSIVSFFGSGGVFMYPILLVFAFGVAIALVLGFVVVRRTRPATNLEVQA